MKGILLHLTRKMVIIVCRSDNGEVSVRYRKHSNIGAGKVKIIGHILPSVFSPTILSDFSSSGALQTI
jgi:hypothetical protein